MEEDTDKEKVFNNTRSLKSRTTAFSLNTYISIIYLNEFIASFSLH